jgi:hypothetical protein
MEEPVIVKTEVKSEAVEEDVRGEIQMIPESVNKK